MAKHDVFARFGVNPEIGNTEYGDSLSLPATPERIRDAIEPLIPADSGHDLLRIGGHADGSYLIPNDLEGIEACFSPGTNNFKNFEDHLTNTFGVRAYLCDYTSSVEKLRTPLVPGMQFFEKKWLDVAPHNDNVVIDSWVAGAAPGNSDLILQMDIEGAEYRNILHASEETLRRFRVIVVELHGLGLLGDVRFLNGIFGPFVKKLSKLFQAVHVHPNYCCGETQFAWDLAVPHVLEATLIRKDRVRERAKKIVLPHPLDELNVSKKAPLHLGGLWLEKADRDASRIAALEQSVKWLESENSRLAVDMGNRPTMQDLFPLLFESYVAGKTEVARGKPTDQSSYHDGETRRPFGGVDGSKTGRPGFHTKIERNPWWLVDLRAEFRLDAILLFNRLDRGSERVKTLRVLTSRNGTDWTTIYNHNGRGPFGGIKPLNGVPPLLVPCRPHATADALIARFVKLAATGITGLHLDQVEVYGTPIE